MGVSSEDVPEKPVVSTTVRSVSTLRPATEEAAVRQQPDHDLKNAIWAIVTGVALPCIPILVILAILLYFILGHKVDPWTGYPELALNVTSSTKSGFDAVLANIRHNGGGPAYLVNYNPSTLTTIASWTSRIIPYLTSSIMALVAFFAARYIVQQSKRGDDAVLPDPEQLTILIGLLGGAGVSPLKDTLFYRWLKKERLVSPVPAVMWVFVFITFLGFIIPAIDTWFGIATHPTTITLLSNTSQPQKYGRRLNDTGLYAPCPNGPRENISAVWWGPGDVADESLYWPCNVQAFQGATTHVALLSPADATKLQYNLATTTELKNYTYDSKDWFFYGDPKSNAELDFLAATYALSTTCRPMTKACTSQSGEDGTFQCSKGFYGNWTNPWPYVMNNLTAPPDSGTNSPAGIAFASDAQLSSSPGLVNGTIGPQWPNIIPTNPIYFGTWGFDFPSEDYLPEGLYADDEIVQSATNTLWFLNCTTDVAEVTYAWVNGSIHTFQPTLAKPDMAALFVGAWSLIGVSPYFEEVMNRVLANMGTIVSVSDSMTELADTWATEFSKNSLALAVGAFAPFENKIEQRRDAEVIVARIPLAPLYLLVGVKMVYVLAVIVLAVGAYAFTHPAETEVVKAQLSTRGLAAAHFDQPALLQENAVKAVQARLDMVNKRSQTDPPLASNDGNNGSEPAPGELKRSETSPAELEGGRPKVGIVPDADGTWKFVVMANGVWHSISPIVKSFVENEAKKGDLGVVGGVISAWK